MPNSDIVISALFELCEYSTTTPGGGNSGNTDNSNDKVDAGNGGLSDNSKPNNVTISGRPSNVVQRLSETISYGNVQTGDKTNVPRLVLICIAAVLVLMIVVIKKPGNKDE